MVLQHQQQQQALLNQAVLPINTTTPPSLCPAAVLQCHGKIAALAAGRQQLKEQMCNM